MADREANLLNLAESYKANTHVLMNQGFKAEALLNMMNSCAEKC